jgi:hypothetical protein
MFWGGVCPGPGLGPGPGPRWLEKEGMVVGCVVISLEVGMSGFRFPTDARPLSQNVQNGSEGHLASYSKVNRFISMG